MPSGRPTVEIVIRRAPMPSPSRAAASASAGSRASRFNSGSPMPITTTWLSRSEKVPARFRRARRAHGVCRHFTAAAGCGASVRRFRRGQVADHAVESGGAEDAAHRAADLRADAGGAMLLVVAQQHALDPLAVVQFQQQFFRAVGRLAVLGDPRGPDLELGGKPLAELGRQVGHFLEPGGPLLEEPLPHLPRPIRRQTVPDEPVAELGGGLLKDGDH